MAKMKKQELVDALSLETGMFKQQIGEVLDAMARVAKTRLEHGADFDIPGVVSMKVTHRGERNGRNPKTGETIRIKAMNVVRARPAAALRAV